MGIRLRHISMLAHDIDQVAQQLCSVFGLEVAFIDPRADEFGLENRVLPVGGQFLEVLTPTRPDNVGARYLARRGGDTGWVVICQTDDHGAFKARLRQLGVRTAWEWREGLRYSLCLLNQRDTGGSYLEVDWAEGWDDPEGPWPPAGDEWRSHVRSNVVSAIRAAEVQSPEPEAVAERWAAILGLPLQRNDGIPELQLENAVIRFVPAADGRGEGLGGVDLAATDAHIAVNRAQELGLPVQGSTIVIGGLRFHLV